MKSRQGTLKWNGSKFGGFVVMLVHDYLGVDLERVWNIIENDLSKLKSAVEKMI